MKSQVTIDRIGWGHFDLRVNMDLFASSLLKRSQVENFDSRLRGY